MAQTYVNLRLTAVDNSEAEDNENKKYILKNFPAIKFQWAGRNLGFAKAYNIMIREAMARGEKYFIALNPDMILAPDFVVKIVKAIEADKEIGAAAPKILKWDFENNKKTDFIDSYGLFVTKSHRFSDSRQGEKDDPKAKPREVFGFTGAAVIFRLDALRDAAFDNGRDDEYFDELMFMYKEDCDLSYRLRLAGWKIVFTPEAVAYHDRTASPLGNTSLKIALNRKNKSQQVKKWSFINHWILLVKFSCLPHSLNVLLATAWYQSKSLVYAALFERFLLKELVRLWKIRYKIRKRRDQLKIRLSADKIKRLFDIDNHAL